MTTTPNTNTNTNTNTSNHYLLTWSGPHGSEEIDRVYLQDHGTRHAAHAEAQRLAREYALAGMPCTIISANALGA